MGKIKCSKKGCNKEAEYVIITATGEKRFLCKKHAQDLMKTIAAIRTEKL